MKLADFKHFLPKKWLSMGRYPIVSLVVLLLGFWRETVVAAQYGLSAELDVYVAMMSVYLFFGVQVSNTLEMVFIAQGSKLANSASLARNLYAAMKSVLMVDFVTVAALLYLGPVLVGMVFKGFDSAQVALANEILQLLLIAVVLVTFSGLIKASLNVCQVFAPGLMAGGILSGVTGLSVLFFGGEAGINALVWGFVAGNVAVFVTLVTVYVHKIGVGLLKEHTEHRVFRGINLWKPAAAVFVGEIFYQGYSLIERSFASELPVGTISSFSYAWTLIQVPVALIVLPLSTILFPKLARAYSRSRGEGYDLFKRYAGPLVAFGVIAAVSVCVFAEELVRLVFLRGSFSEKNAEQAAQILAIIVFSLPFLCFGRMVKYSLYSINQYASASLCQGLAFLTMLVASPLLIPFFGVKGLAYGSAIAISSQSVAMFFVLRTKLSRGSA